MAQLRKEQGLTQRELAEQLHVTDKAVSKWETGKGFPDLKLLDPLCQVLEVSLVELLQGERTPSPTLSKEAAGQVAAQAMEQSQKATARTYLRLFRWILTGIGLWCILSLLPKIGVILAIWLLIHGSNESVGVIGGSDGPTAILISSGPPMIPPWFSCLVQAAALIICIVLIFRVRKVERRLS